MKIYKPKFTDKKTGQVKECENYYIDFVDNKQVRRRLPAFHYKDATESTAEKIKEILCSGGLLNQDLQRWIENLPDVMRRKLISFGIIDGQRMTGYLNNTLAQHVEDFYRSLVAKGSGRHAEQTKTIINKIFTNCGFKVLSDIDANRVYTFLDDRYREKKIGQRTFNWHLKACCQFCRWLVKERRTTINLLEHLSCKSQTEFKKIRRALTLDEQKKLLEAALSGKKHHNLTGHERYLVYILALQTGLRAGEIASLTVSSFDFTDNTITLQGACAKNKQTAVICLKRETAALLQSYLAGKLPQAKAFDMPVAPAEMMKADLTAAGLSFKTDEGDIDFHSLRGTFITNLANAGVYPKDLQVLARHSTVATTMRHYVFVRRESTKRIIESQPDLTVKSQAIVKRIA